MTDDLVAAAIYKSAGASVHWREGSPNLRLAGWLIIGSVPMAFAGGVHRRVRSATPRTRQDFLKLCIGFALLLAAATYALRLYINLRRVHGAAAPPGDENPTSGRSRPCSSARSAACWSGSPRSAPAR